jgi:DNA-binding SARP family transcriptional activator/tetratricopeptide (TPR) repeat protein
MAVRFRVLGTIEADDDGHPIDLGHLRQRWVLAVLLIEANRMVSVEQLQNRVWGQHPPQRADGTLRTYLCRLRRALVGTVDVEIVRRPGGYRLVVDPMAVDLHRFEDLVSRARTADTDDAAALLDQALGLWRGDAFGGLDCPWLNSLRENLDRQRLAAILDRNDLALADGDHGRLLAELSGCAASHPLDERLTAQLMLTLYRCARQADALETYDRTRRLLADEFGTDPGPTLRQLHRQILVADPVLAAPPRAATVPVRKTAEIPTPRQLPATPRSFTGRSAELTALGTILDRAPESGSAMTIAAIGGAGGVGKTWLALRWAHDNTARFPDGQLYVDLHGFDPAVEPLSPAATMRGFLDAFGVDAATVPADPAAQAGLYRSLVSGRRMLVLLDNARDSAQVAPLLPGTATCTVLVTSRHRLPGLVTEHGARPLALEALRAGEAREMLTGRLGVDRVTAEPQAVDILLRWCAGLPLALGVVAARATVHPGSRLAAFAAELADAATRLDALDAGESAVSLRAVLSCSYHALAPATARVYRLFGLAPGADISLRAIAGLTACSAADARAHLCRLTAAHVVEEHLPGRYRMHDLVRLHAAEQGQTADGEAERRTALRRILDHYLHTAYAADRLINPHRDTITVIPAGPAVTPERLADPAAALAWFGVERPALLVAARRAADAGFDTHAWQLAWTVTTFLDRHGYWHDLTAVEGTALAAARRTADRGGQAQSHRGLGRACTGLGRHGDARAHFRSALDLHQQLGDHTGQARAHAGLANLCERQGRHLEALQHARRTLDLHRGLGHRVGQARALATIGSQHSRLGDHSQALSYGRQALNQLEALGDRTGTADAWDCLGRAHHRLGDSRQATACYRRALVLYRDLGDRYYEADTLARLGDAHHVAGAVGPARQARLDALDILTQLGHSDADRLQSKLGGGSTNGTRPEFKLGSTLQRARASTVSEPVRCHFTITVVTRHDVSLGSSRHPASTQHRRTR